MDDNQPSIHGTQKHSGGLTLNNKHKKQMGTH